MCYFSYELASADSPFHVDPKNGQLKTARRLDYENQVSSFKINLTNQVESPSTRLT